MTITLVNTNSGNEPSNTTSHTHNLPDGSDVSGRLIVDLFASDGSGESFTYPDASWNELAHGGSGFTYGMVYHETDGTEGYPSTGATITVTVTSVEQGSHATYLWDGYATSTAPEYSTEVNGTGTNCDPGTLTPSWGSDATMWMVFCVLNGASSTTPRFSGYPSGDYTTNKLDSISTGGNGVVQATSYRLNTASSENPSAFTSDTSVTFSTFTLGIKPAAAAASTYTGWYGGGW